VQGTTNKSVTGDTRGRLNHLTIEEAQDAPDVVYCMFIVHGAKALVLFDSGATCPPNLHESIIYH